MPNRLVSEIPAGPPSVMQGSLQGMVWIKRFSIQDPRLSR